jgi:hypothetical protein
MGLINLLNGKLKPPILPAVTRLVFQPVEK